MMIRFSRVRVAVPALALTGVLALAGCSGGGGPGGSSVATTGGGDVASRYGTVYENTGSGPMVAPTIPQTPSIKTDFGQLQCRGKAPSDVRRPAPAGCTRVFTLTASQFEQTIANFPVQHWKVWGYNGSTPGPTLVSYQGEPIRIVLHNRLPIPTTLHPHGEHQPNADDGVAGISEPNPIAPGGSHTYAFTPGHVGTFAYHSHTDGPVEELRGLDGMHVVLPRTEHRSVRVNDDYVMTLQQFAPQPVTNGKPDGTKVKNGVLTVPFPGGTGDFPISTIDGKTGDASGGPITIHKGDLVRIRLYNASNLAHSMHLHGHDMILVSKNGHAVPQTRETTQNIAPGDFFEVEFRADNPGNWIFHCHIPHHTANAMLSGYRGAPVGMTRIFHYAGYQPVPRQYFSYHGQNSIKAP